MADINQNNWADSRRASNSPKKKSIPPEAPIVTGMIEAPGSAQEEQDLSKLTKAQLLDLASKTTLNLSARMTKENIIKALVG